MQIISKLVYLFSPKVISLKHILLSHLIQQWFLVRSSHNLSLDPAPHNFNIQKKLIGMANHVQIHMNTKQVENTLSESNYIN